MFLMWIQYGGLTLYILLYGVIQFEIETLFSCSSLIGLHYKTKSVLTKIRDGKVNEDPYRLCKENWILIFN